MMTLSKPIAVGLMILAGQFSAFAGELAVLRNGFTVRFERREQSGNTTRLYTREGFVDIASAEIVAFEEEEDGPTDLDASKAATSSLQTAQPAASGTPAAAGPAGPGSVPGTGLGLNAVAVFPATSSPATPGLGTPGLGTPGVTRASLDQLVREASSRHRLDPDFVNSVIKAESNFQPRAVSRKGAQGLMQLMPGTASLLGVTDPFDPQANVEGGTAYLSWLLDQYGNDAVKALAAYNAGPQRVDQYHGVPPYTETRAYVARIVRDYNAKKRAQMSTRAASTKAASRKSKTRAPASAQPQEAGVARTRKPA